ncbi:NAD/NADP-dependent betaine aldehyde dehydrogenase [Zhongshania aliphaticivorans]|uniref:NAD/NADP-dependent betaine aldehyde dehydrogenase n=1 Tax=Zhongshania aliphaticivorans TaxID=1470434 RepID=A0A5S9N650_9GAMM|nr:aldehyde dehydrogenase family protein [Zhongshania aliphaticivorans]CAA0081932.1 NAD/NADP-dependent betaine aldehyde dehydrogenase [Zhongshania aliphaticivorans]CAA0084570.1 NAD/NADP-dependent betaine aldehyde dehydrogenase [Zhongshania aliphaticivorans]
MLQNIIDGAKSEPNKLLPSWVCNASTAEPLFQQRSADVAQIDKAIVVAEKVHQSGVWANLAPAARAAILDDAANALEAQSAKIAEADALSTGAILKFTSVVASICPMAFRSAANLLRNLADQQNPALAGPHGELQIERLALGPAAIIAPWNAPSGIACHKIASALAAGCPVIVKPSEWAPLSAQYIVEALLEVGFPAGLIQLLHGDAEVGAALVSDSRIAAVSFTGGLAGGRAVAAACGQDIKPAQLELGGNNALVVLADADIDASCDAVVQGMVTLNGQWCRALGRLLIHSSLAEQVISGVMSRLEALRIGSAVDSNSDMGPLVHAKHLEHIESTVAAYKALGAEVLQSTPLPSLSGYYFAPALITGLSPEQTRNETFGPVATVHTFSDDEEAVALANGTPFGLAGYVFGEEQHCWAVANRMRTGIVKINAVTMMNLNPLAPRPAWGLSGLGDEGVSESFEFFRGSRVIGVGARP